MSECKNSIASLSKLTVHFRWFETEFVMVVQSLPRNGGHADRNQRVQLASSRSGPREHARRGDLRSQRRRGLPVPAYACASEWGGRPPERRKVSIAVSIYCLFTKLQLQLKIHQYGLYRRLLPSRTKTKAARRLIRHRLPMVQECADSPPRSPQRDLL